MARIYSLFSNFSKREPSGIHISETQRQGEEIESYLKLIEKIMNEAQRTTSGSCSKPPQFYIGQCKYLADKLVLVVEGAHAYLVPFIDGEASCSSKDMARFLDACKQLHASAELVQSFIQECCKTPWIQAALGMLNVSEHVSSIGFDLEVCSHVFSNMGGGGTNMLSLEGVDRLAKGEDETVQQRVLVDKKALSKRVKAWCKSSESSHTDRVFGKRLLAALKRGSNQAGYCDQDLGSVSQIGELGRGGSGVVHRGIWYKNIDVAKKVIDASQREMLIQAKLSHSNVTFLLCYKDEDGDHTKTTLLMDLMEGNLFGLIGNRMNRGRDYPFPILVAVDIMLQVGMGMQCAHEATIVHRDLKPQNIFSKHVRRTEFVLVKVGDFGSAKVVDRDQMMTSMQGTIRYMAPEMLSLSHRKKDEEKKHYENLEQPYRGVMKEHPYKCDIHSYAMLCFEILTGQQPFSENPEKQRLDDIGNLILGGERPVLPEWCPEKLKLLIERCWSKDAKTRPSFGDICKELRHIKYSLLMTDLKAKQTPILRQPHENVEGIQGSSFPNVSNWNELVPFGDSSVDKEEEFCKAKELFEEILEQQSGYGRYPYDYIKGRFFINMDDLVLEDQIGEGAEAKIYGVRGGLVVKSFRKDFISFKNCLQIFDSGIRTAFERGFHHQSPLSMIKGGTLLTDSRVRGTFGIVMERKWGDLRKLIDWHMMERKKSGHRTKDPPFTEVQSLQMMLGIAKDMKTLHNLSPMILHRDIKCSNVLVHGRLLPSLDGGFEVTVCDYGHTQVVGTRFWRAPEILEALRYFRVGSHGRRLVEQFITTKSDVYSYGMMCYEILTGLMPFESELGIQGPRNLRDTVIEGGRPVLPKDLDSRIRAVITRCWAHDPDQRPTFAEIVDRFEILTSEKCTQFMS